MKKIIHIKNIRAACFCFLTACFCSLPAALNAQLISSLAGFGPSGGVGGYNGDGIAATTAQLGRPHKLTVDPAGNIYIAEVTGHRIRKIDISTGLISTIAGTGVAGFSGDGGLATAAQISSPSGIALDAAGNIYIGDNGNYRIRKITVATGIITTIAGVGPGYGGDGGPATLAEFDSPQGVALDPAGNVYIVEYGSHRVRKITVATGIINTICGTAATWGFSGDGFAATTALLRNPSGIATDAAGNIYIADSWNWRIRKITAATGIITTVAGVSAGGGFTGDGVLATVAQLNLPTDVAIDGVGNLYIADALNDRIRKVTATTGLISTIAGNGVSGYNGDGILATTARLMVSTGVAIDASCNVYIADQTNNRVRKVTGVGAPTITISGALSVCSGQAITLTASGGSIYSWNTGATTTSITQNPTATATYTVTGTSPAGCSAIKQHTVTVNSAPTITISGNSTLCPGGSTTLSASGGSTYSWSTGATTTSITLNPTATATYTLTGTASGCSNTAQQTITVNSLPTINITGTSSICAGGSTVLSASGGSTYSWSTGATTTSITLNPTSTNTYTLTGTSAGCSNTDQQTVTVNTIPSVTINGFAALCPGSSTTLSAGGASTYSWSTGATTTTISITPTTTTTYTLTGTSAAGCTNTSQQIVTVANPPTINITGTSSICAGASTTLSASGGSTYLWSTGATTASIILNPTATATYTVTGTAVGGCSNTGQQIVTVNNLPTISITGTSSICAGSSTTLSASGGSTYLWSTGATSSSISLNPTTTTTYTVTGTSAGCSSTNLQTITVNTLPSVAINGSTALCPGNSTTLSASGGSTYLWSTGATTTTITITPTATTTYTLTGTTSGCSNTVQQTVTVNGSPTITIGGNSALCSGNSTTLSASGGSTYLWNTGATTTSIIQSPTSSTTYTVTGTAGGGCSGTATVSVAVNNLPTAAINSSNAICLGNSITLTASGSGGYSWNTGATTINLTQSPTANTSYSLTVTDGNGCTNTAQKSITVNVLPSVAINGFAAICPGSSTTLSASGASTYSWSTGATTTTLTETPTTNTSYTLTGTSAAGCTSTAQQTVTVGNPPTITITGNIAICIGNTTTLSASGGATYLWSTGATTATITASPTSTTTYSITGTAVGGCNNAGQQTVTVNNLPTAAINSNTSLCQGSSITLTASGGTGYSWNTGATTATITESPTSNTTYTLNVSDGNGCKNSAQQSVIVNVLPSLTISGFTALCPGSSATLTASGASTYSWSTGATTTTITETPTSNVTYTLTGTSAAGCINTIQQTVTVGNPPSITITGNDTICIGSSTTLSASGGATYFWNNGATTSFITITPTATSTYAVTGTAVGGCNNAGQQTVTVNNLPTPSITGVSSICSGSSTTLSVSSSSGGLSAYAWNTGSTTTSITISPTIASTYSVMVTDSSGCSNSATFPFAVNNLPTASISGSSSVCIGNTGTLSALGGISFIWDDGSTSSSLNISPTAATNYSVTVTDNNGCTNTASTSVVVNAGLTPSITGNNTLCQGNATTLSTSGGLSYSWNTGSSSSSITVSPASTDSYTVTVTDASGCSGTAIILVTVNNPPLASISTSGSGNICQGSSITLTAFGSGSYSWNTGTTTNNLTVTPTANTTYSVTITDTNGCTNTATFPLTINNVPTASIIGNTAICSGNTGVLTASGSTSGGYLWDNGSTTSTLTISPTATTNYSVTVADNGCTGFASISVIVGSPSTSSITAQVCQGESYTLADGSATDSSGIYTSTLTNAAGCDSIVTTTLTVISLPAVNITPTKDLVKEGELSVLHATGASIYLWDDGTTTSSLQVYPVITTTYCVVGTNLNGCADTSCITISVQDFECPGDTLFIPTAFSPNGDGQNDEWRVYGGNCVESVNVFIYNRWANVVYSSEDLQETWDGTYQGKPLDAGVFIYRIHAFLFNNPSAITKTGNISLIR